jgi:hypothetical protein
MRAFVSDLGFGSSLPSLLMDADDLEMVATASADDDDHDVDHMDMKVPRLPSLRRQLSRELYRLDEHEEEEEEVPKIKTQPRITNPPPRAALSPIATDPSTPTTAATAAIAAVMPHTGSKRKHIWKGTTLIAFHTCAWRLSMDAVESPCFVNICVVCAITFRCVWIRFRFLVTHHAGVQLLGYLPDTCQWAVTDDMLDLPGHSSASRSLCAWPEHTPVPAATTDTTTAVRAPTLTAAPVRLVATTSIRIADPSEAQSVRVFPRLPSPGLLYFARVRGHWQVCLGVLHFTR